MKVQFGTDGVRGPAGTPPIVPEVGLALGRAVAAWAHGPVLVGRDPRVSGDALAAAVVAGAAGQGATVVDAGVVPTPAVGCALADGRADAAIVVTASHNAAADNGFKVIGAGGRKPTLDETAQLEAWVAEPPDPVGFGAVHRDDQVRTDWLARLPTPSSLTDVPIVVDFANGAGAVAADWLVNAIPARWTFIGRSGRPNDGCGSEHLGALGRAVVDSGAALGIALDGDGDRCRVVDAHGRPVPGDAVTWLLARHLGVQRLAVTVMSTGALEASLPGVTVVRTPVGDKHLQRVLAAGDATLGAEESGHILFVDHPAGDGLFAGLRLADAVVAAGGTDVFDRFEPLPRATAKVRVTHRPPLGELPGMQELIRALAPDLGEGGRVFLRYSGTEPVLRVLVEGDDATRVAHTAMLVRVAAEELLG